MRAEGHSRIVGTFEISEFRAPAGAVAAREPVRPRVALPGRAAWQRLQKLHDRIQDSRVGDLIGCASLFAGLYLCQFFAGVFS